MKQWIIKTFSVCLSFVILMAVTGTTATADDPIIDSWTGPDNTWISLSDNWSYKMTQNYTTDEITYQSNYYIGRQHNTTKYFKKNNTQKGQIWADSVQGKQYDQNIRYVLGGTFLYDFPTGITIGNSYVTVSPYNTNNQLLLDGYYDGVVNGQIMHKFETSFSTNYTIKNYTSVKVYLSCEGKALSYIRTGIRATQGELVL